MTDQRRVLLRILAGSLLVPTLGVAVPTYQQEYRRLSRAVAERRYQLELLRDRMKDQSLGSADAAVARRVELLQGEREDLLSRFADVGTVDPFEFAARVSADLASAGLTVEQSQPLMGRPAPTIEFTVRGPVAAFLRFLESASNRTPAWTVPYVAITQGPSSEEASMTIEVGYAPVPSGDS